MAQLRYISGYKGQYSASKDGKIFSHKRNRFLNPVNLKGYKRVKLRDLSQHDYNIANQSFPSFRTDLNNVLSAINTSNSGTSRPSGAVAGTIWLDTSGGVTAYILKFYDGADDIALGTINTTANTVDWTDSSVTLGANSVDSDQYVDGSIDQEHLADEVVNEAKLQVSNAPVNGYMLTAQSGDTGGLTWAAAPAADFSSVGEHILPSTDDTYNLGSATFQWANIYTGDLHLSNESKAEGNIVDGTTGNWTIQEGADDLFIVNNKSGKKYKFNLTEV
jgi:hypothetical protein